jgi:hypothetical protein
MVAAPIVSGIVALISVYRGQDASAPMPNDSYKFNQERTDYPDIADQIDTRFTNIFRNPWKGIL